ncbi:MAG: hypothetical protein A2Z16_07210 [Chloroflexi bacterium RBG_16_54_18]|nr:MAG: hypothetical protein A2Z16_07210 [Chloroflexi bacterium RBG_16_54_18]
MIAITGASGYLGSHLTRRLVESGYQVRAVIRNRAKAEQESRLGGLDVEWVEGDVTRPETLANAFVGATAVLHTVAVAIEKKRSSYEEINYRGSLNVVDAARKAGIRRFIYISQLGASADLPYRFLASKGMGEDYVVASALDWTVFRPAVIWGPEDEFANSFARLIPITPFIFPIVGDENSLFQPVWVEDVAASVQKSLDDPSTFRQIYELGGPEVLTLEEIERRTLKALGRRRLLIPFPMTLLRIFVSLMEAVLPNPPVTRNLLELLAVSNVTSNNSTPRFVDKPEFFTSENVAVYMREFRVRDSLAQYLNKQ